GSCPNDRGCAMSRWDERAEAMAERRGRRDGGGGEPANARAVRKALATGHRTLENDLDSLDVLLAFADNPNAPAEQGPPQPGTHQFDLTIEFFGRVAADVRKIREAVGAVDFDPGDKQKFRQGLGDVAKAWELRAQAFAAGDEATRVAALNVAWEREQRARSFK